MFRVCIQATEVPQLPDTADLHRYKDRDDHNLISEQLDHVLSTTNVAPSTTDSVYDAATSGDILALKRALDAGGSSNETDRVRARTIIITAPC